MHVLTTSTSLQIQQTVDKLQAAINLVLFSQQFAMRMNELKMDS